MAGEDRSGTAALALEEELGAAACRFGFYSALRRLECANAEDPRIGRSTRPREDPVRLGQEPSLGFAPSTLAGFERSRENRRSRLSVRFLGLFGPNGPLPLQLTEYVIDRIHGHGDFTLSRFVDLFHHRMISLFYRAWADAEPTVQSDREGNDRFAAYVGALSGAGMSAEGDECAVPTRARLQFAGRMAAPVRNAENLRALLQEYFAAPVEIEEFVGQWLDLPADCRWRLGESPATSALGRTTITGARVWDCQSKFRVVMGPLDLESFRRLLPGRPGLGRLVEWVRAYVGHEKDWDVKLILREEEVPRFRLDGRSGLGWTTWLARDGLGRDGDQLVLNPLAGGVGSG